MIAARVLKIAYSEEITVEYVGDRHFFFFFYVCDYVGDRRLLVRFLHVEVIHEFPRLLKVLSVREFVCRESLRSSV